MVLTPAYCDTEITSPVTVNVVVTFGNGRDAKSSEPIEFTYKPKPNLQVQEVEMHPSLPITAVATDNFLPVEIFNSIGDIVLNNLPEEIMEPAVPVILPAVTEEQGMLMAVFHYVQKIQLKLPKVDTLGKQKKCPQLELAAYYGNV